MEKIKGENMSQRQQNQQLQSKIDSFRISSVNNSFARDYNDTDMLSKPYQTSKKPDFNKVIASSGISESDRKNANNITRISDSSYQNEPVSRYHQRMASDDLIMEESNDEQPQIEYADDQAPQSDVELILTNIFKDLRYITK